MLAEDRVLDPHHDLHDALDYLEAEQGTDQEDGEDEDVSDHVGLLGLSVPCII